MHALVGLLLRILIGFVPSLASASKVRSLSFALGCESEVKGHRIHGTPAPRQLRSAMGVWTGSCLEHLELPLSVFQAVSHSRWTQALSPNESGPPNRAVNVNVLSLLLHISSPETLNNAR